MTVSMRRYYLLRMFAPGELRRTLRAVLPAGSTIDTSRRLSNGSFRPENDVSDDDLRLVCDLSREFIEAFGDVYLTLEGHDDELRVRGSADSLQRICEVFEQLERALRLQEIVRPTPEPKHRCVPGARRLRCFLSFRPDEATARIASELERFLALLDVHVITASSEEPRSIGNKVLARLDREKDFIAVVVSPTGACPWTPEEVGQASARGALVVPVVQTGSPCDAGLFNGFEHVSFAPGHVGDAFLRLLETVRGSHPGLD